MTSSADFTSCFRDRVSQLRLEECERRNPSYCGSRFGEKPEHRLDVCKQLLSGAADTTMFASQDDADEMESASEAMSQYNKCMDQIRHRVPYLRFVCLVDIGQVYISPT